MQTKLTMVSIYVCGVRYTEFVQAHVQPDGRTVISDAEYRRLSAKYVPRGYARAFGV